MNFIDEIQWRGIIHSMTPGIEETLNQGMRTGYIGFDPSARSLQIGNLMPIMLLTHFQRAGHKPIALVGGATGMIGDPSGKSEERNLLSVEEIQFNMDRIKNQLQRFLDFDSGANSAEIVNNHDWFKEMKYLEFLRDTGKYLTVSYMLAKDSVQLRLQSGISFTEFSYQLLQAYDFYWLYTHKNCLIQLGGSDQWGNITSGTELIRRKAGGEAFALTCNLVTRADGTKFGKSAAGENIWLDPQMTSPYKFYQFWLNCTDDEASKFLRIFTLLSQQEIEALQQEHQKAPHLRPMQKALAKDVTIRVHSEDDYRAACEASEILFGKGTTEALQKLSQQDFLDIFDGVPTGEIAKADLDAGIDIINLLTEKTNFFSSKGEVRRLIKSNGLMVNKARIDSEEYVVTKDALLSGMFIVVQKGKKNYFLVKAV